MATKSGISGRLRAALLAAGLVMSVASVASGSGRPASASSVGIRATLARAIVAPQSTGSISGTVTGNSAVLQGICVFAFLGNSNQSSAASSTNGSGTYTFANLATGMYNFRFDNNGDCGAVNSGSWVTRVDGVTINAGANPAHNVVMTAGGQITGTIKSSGVGVQYICVVVDTGMFSSGVAYVTSTAADGTFTLNNLPTVQSYVLRFDNNGDCPESHPNPGSWVTQWYNDESSFSKADLVSVPSTTPVPLSSVVVMAAGATISGKVINADTGAPLAKICVNANLNMNGGGFSPGVSAQTSPAGTYVLDNLSSGGYTVAFSNCPGQAGSYVPQWWESAASQQAASPVNVTAPATASGIDAALVPGGSITGTVTGNTVPLPGICVSVATGSGVSGQFSSLSTPTNSKGVYTLTGLAIGQSYVIRFDNNNDCQNQGNPGNQGSWVTQWYKGASSFSSASKVIVSTTTPVTGINAAMAQGGSISGIVNGNGNPQSGICVSIDPGLPSGSVTQQVQTFGNGQYLLNNLAPGTYEVRFDSYSCSFNGNAGPWMTQWNGGVTTWSAAAANPVSVTVGTSTTVNAGLVTGAGSISGMVAALAGGSQGQGQLSGICVSALNSAGKIVASTKSGQSFFNLNNANYALFGLIPGAGPYKVRFDSCSGAAGSWVTQWYDDASSSGAATPIPVASGANAPNVDASMVAISETHAGPNTGPITGGTVVTLSGSGFTGAMKVLFGGVAGTSLSVTSDSILTVRSPAHTAGKVLLVVVTPSGPCSNATAVGYIYVPAPTVSKLTPNTGPATGGTVVTITGTNLIGATAVHFGAALATIDKIVSATQIQVTSPKGSGTVDVTVTTAGGTSSKSTADHFTY